MGLRNLTHKKLGGGEDMTFVVWLGLIVLLLSVVVWISAYELMNQANAMIFAKPAEAHETKPLYKLVLDQFHHEEGQKLGMNAETFKTYVNIMSYITYVNPNLPQQQKEDMAKAIIKYSSMYCLPVGIVVGVIAVESTFRADAVGRRTKSGRAKGAMQVMWPLHRKLAQSLDVNQVTILTADGGVKVGCCLLKRYIQYEKSILGGLIRFFSVPSKSYVLNQVMTTYLAFEQMEHGLISIDQIDEAHQNEVRSMRRLNSKGR